MGCFPYECASCGGGYKRCGQGHPCEDGCEGGTCVDTNNHTPCHGGQFCWEDMAVVEIDDKQPYYKHTAALKPVRAHCEHSRTTLMDLVCRARLCEVNTTPMAASSIETTRRIAISTFQTNLPTMSRCVCPYSDRHATVRAGIHAKAMQKHSARLSCARAFGARPATSKRRRPRLQPHPLRCQALSWSKSPPRTIPNLLPWKMCRRKTSLFLESAKNAKTIPPRRTAHLRVPRSAAQGIC